MSTGKSKFPATASREKFLPPIGRVKPPFWTSKFLSDRVIEGGKYKLKKILEAKRDEKGEWKFLSEWRGFDSSHTNWEPAHLLVHGYTKGFIDFLKKHPEIGVLLTDCLFKPDRQVEEDGKKPVVNPDLAFYGPHSSHSRVDPPIPPPAVRPAKESFEDRASSSAADLQRPVPDQTGWWSHAFLPGRTELHSA